MAGVLKIELKACEAAVKSVEDTVGGKRKLREHVGSVENNKVKATHVFELQTSAPRIHLLSLSCY